MITFGAVWLIIRRTSREPGAMIISAAEVRIDVPRAFKTPFLIPIAMIRAAAVDDGAAHGTTRDRKTKRFALAVEGPGSTGAARGRPEWLFSWRGGGLLDIPIVNREPVVPNLVLLFVERIPGPEAKRGSGLMFSRSRLIHAAGAGEIPGVFAEVRDPNGARMALGRLGVLAPIRLSDLYDLQPPGLKRKLGPLN